MSTTTTTTTQPPVPLRRLYLALFLTCPLLIALPPRKLDFYTFTLSGLFVFSAQKIAFADAQRRAATHRAGVLADTDAGGVKEAGPGRKEKREGVLGMARDLWMGNEQEGWKERRVKEERERLAGGEGYGDLMVGQVREALGRDRRTGERVGGEEEGGREGR